LNPLLIPLNSSFTSECVGFANVINIYRYMHVYCVISSVLCTNKGRWPSESYPPWMCPFH